MTPHSRLPIGVNTFVWASPLTDRELAEILPKIAGWGFDAVELPLEQPGDWNPEEAANLLREYSLSSVLCAVFPPGRELTAAPPDVIANTQDYLRHCIDVAVLQGSRAVVGPMYTSVGRTWRTTAAERASAITTLRESLRPVVDYAGERGVRLGLEPLNRYETSLINTVDQALQAIDGLPSEAIGLNLDTYHQNIEETHIGEAIRRAGAKLIHIQVCGNDRGSPGQDHIDWDDIRDALADVGYTGILGIESFTADNATIATAASIWRPLAESQDALATRGLEFLRDWRARWPA